MINAVRQITWGTDPEGFFQRAGEIIGSEKLIPTYGLSVGKSKVVRDGVQFELNPSTGENIRHLGINISGLFSVLAETLRQNPDVSLNFSGLVEVSKAELDSLSPSTRILGCMPSFNLYGSKPIDVDPTTYRKRSSGGHIHMGLTTPIFDPHTGNPDLRQRLVPLLDIFVGNSAVLLDRDSGAAERRQNYGRAGEYRLPKHGLEYRTTSNFWLRDYTLMNFTFGMASAAIAVLQQSLYNDIEQELVDVVDITKVAEAINTNNFELAAKNLLTIAPFIRKHFTSNEFPLDAYTVERFLTFAEAVNSKGIERYFPTETIVERWQSGVYEDFRTFLARL